MLLYLDMTFGVNALSIAAKLDRALMLLLEILSALMEPFFTAELIDSLGV